MFGSPRSLACMPHRFTPVHCKYDGVRMGGGVTHQSGRVRTSIVESHASLPLASYSAKRFPIETMIGAMAETSSATVKSPVIGLPTSDALSNGPAPPTIGSVCRGRRSYNRLPYARVGLSRKKTIQSTTTRAGLSVAEEDDTINYYTGGSFCHGTRSYNKLLYTRVRLSRKKIIQSTTLTHIAHKAITSLT